MTRIPLLDENDPATPPEARKRLLEAKQSRGKLINIYRAMANRPEALAAFTQLAATVYRSGSTLKPQHGEMAYLTATAVNDCFY